MDGWIYTYILVLTTRIDLETGSKRGRGAFLSFSLFPTPTVHAFFFFFHDNTILTSFLRPRMIPASMFRRLSTSSRDRGCFLFIYHRPVYLPRTPVISSFVALVITIIYIDYSNTHPVGGVLAQLLINTKSPNSRKYGLPY